MPAQPGLLPPAGGCGWGRLCQAGPGNFDTREWLRAQKGPTLLRPALGSSWAPVRCAPSCKTITNGCLNPSSVWGSCQSFSDQPDAISRLVCVSAGGNAFNLVTEIKLNLKKKKKSPGILAAFPLFTTRCQCATQEKGVLRSRLTPSPSERDRQGALLLQSCQTPRVGVVRVFPFPSWLSFHPWFSPQSQRLHPKVPPVFPSGHLSSSLGLGSRGWNLRIYCAPG